MYFITGKRNHTNAMQQLTRPELIEIPSLARSPVAPVLFNLSDPARSTKCNFVCKTSYSCDNSPAVPDNYKAIQTTWKH